MESSTNIQTTQLEVDEASKPAEQPAPPKPEKPKPSFMCLVCGKSYSKKTSLFTHHKTHPEHCVHCGENRGSSVENIYNHNQNHIKIRPFICKLCGESFLRNQQFVEHEKSHDSKKQPPEEATAPTTPTSKDSKYKCKECQSNFSNWKLFYKHQQETGHVNEKFLCEICGSEFFSNFLLSQHRRRVHKRTDETFTCTLCSKVFATKPNMDSHIKKIHQNTENKKFICEVCNNSFSSAPNLKQHIKTVHEVEKEYECQTCKKPFKAKNRLTRHEKEVHMLNNGNPEEIRKYNCDHCQKKYKRSWHQARHSQMKHENSNASTATTTSSSATTPPTPEINGNIPNNNNNYQENFNNFQPSTMPQSTQLPLQQVPNQPSATQPIQSNELNLQQQHQAQSIIPPAVNNMWSNVNIPPQQHYYSQQQSMTTSFQTTSDLTNNNQSPGPLQQLHTPAAINGEFVNYGEPPYSQQHKYEQIQTAPTTPPSIPNHYDTWNQQQPQTAAASSWDYNQPNPLQQQPIYTALQQQPPQQSQPTPQQQQSNWYYNPNQHHYHQAQGMYNTNYNNYKTDYNCLNDQQQQPHSAAPFQQQLSNHDQIYNHNNGHYQYHQQPPQNHLHTNPHPYAMQQQQQLNQTDYPQHSNTSDYHQNFHNSM